MLSAQSSTGQTRRMAKGERRKAESETLFPTLCGAGKGGGIWIRIEDLRGYILICKEASAVFLPKLRVESL